jgi:hypothetical protein
MAALPGARGGRGTGRALIYRGGAACSVGESRYAAIGGSNRPLATGADPGARRAAWVQSERTVTSIDAAADLMAEPARPAQGAAHGRARRRSADAGPSADAAHPPPPLTRHPRPPALTRHPPPPALTRHPPPPPALTRHPPPPALTRHPPPPLARTRHPRRRRRCGIVRRTRGSALLGGSRGITHRGERNLLVRE